MYFFSLTLSIYSRAVQKFFNCFLLEKPIPIFLPLSTYKYTVKPHESSLRNLAFSEIQHWTGCSGTNRCFPHPHLPDAEEKACIWWLPPPLTTVRHMRLLQDHPLLTFHPPHPPPLRSVTGCCMDFKKPAFSDIWQEFGPIHARLMRLLYHFNNVCNQNIFFQV